MARRTRAATTFSSREFNQDTGRAKSAAKRGPVIITDRGQPSHVLLTFVDYQQLIGRQENIIDLLGAPSGVEDADLRIASLRDPARSADLG
jgi:hypothetical protein